VVLGGEGCWGGGDAKVEGGVVGGGGEGGGGEWGGGGGGGMGVKSPRQGGRQVEGANGKSRRAGHDRRQREREWEGGSVHEQERDGGREKWQSTAHKDRFF